MRAARQLPVLVTRELDPGFVQQRGRIDADLPPRAAHVPARNSLEFIVNAREQFLLRIGIAAADCIQQFRDLRSIAHSALPGDNPAASSLTRPPTRAPLPRGRPVWDARPFLARFP